MATVIILLPLLILMELIEGTGVIGGSNQLNIVARELFY